MKDKKVRILNIITPLFMGLFAGLLSTLILSEIFQYLTAQIFGVENVLLLFDAYKMECVFNLPPNLSDVGSLIILFSPSIFIIINIEFNSFLFTKTSIGFYRNFLIVYQLILTGFLMITVLWGALQILFDIKSDNDFVMIANDILKMSFPINIFFLLFMIFILVAFLNITSKRIMKYINV